MFTRWLLFSLQRTLVQSQTGRTRRGLRELALIGLRFAGLCTYHLSRCMLASFSGSVGGNMVGRIWVWRLLGTSDQSENHWPSLVISWGDKPVKYEGFC